MDQISFFKAHPSIERFILGYLYATHKLDGNSDPYFSPKGMAAMVIPLEIKNGAYIELEKPPSKF